MSDAGHPSGMVTANMDELDPQMYLDDDTPAPLENLFTLPFALHLKPLPHYSFLAEQDSSNASSDQDDNGEGSDASSANSNYKAGMHRLRPHSVSVPPHSLKMISMLLERTGCLDAVPVWGQLIEMLDGADEDPHFANLRAFFDARFDTNGKLKDDFNGLQRTSSRRKRGSFTRNHNTGMSPPRYDGDIRRPSVASSSGAANIFNIKRRKSSKLNEQDEYEEGSVGESSGTPKPRQPEIIVVGKEGVDNRAVRFKIRLDLHSIGLAPSPPRPPIIARGSARSTMSKRLTGSPPQKQMSELLGVHRVLSNTSSNHSHSDSLSLHPIGSPDSFRSQGLSEGSDEHHQTRSGFLPQNGSPAPSSRKKEKKTSRTFTGSSAALTSATSEFGTSPDSIDPKVRATSNGAKIGSFSKNGENARRPSMIQKLMDFKGLRSSSTRSNRSASNMSNFSADEAVSHQDTTAKLVLNTNTGQQSAQTVVSPASETHAQDSLGYSFNQLTRNRSQTIQSDMSNEEAVDMVDDEGSVTSSNHYGSASKRRASSSANANSLLGFKPAPGMRPVQEGSVFSTNPIHSDEEEMVLSSSVATGDGWRGGDGNDFLNLWRKAANTSLTLRQTLRPTMTSPARTPKGSASAGISPFPNAQTPPHSIELEDQERIEVLLAPFRDSQADSWWLSGSVDPLPISIACALSEGLGWNGIMDLCYGKGSKSERSGSYQPLGRAAELDRKQEADKSRVQNWAQTVAGTSSESKNQKDMPKSSSTTNEELIAREKLAALALTTEVGSDHVAPSESASVKGKKDQSNNLTKIGNWLKKRSGVEDENPEVSTAEQEMKLKSPFADSDTRSWQDWAELLRSISRWIVEYETTRVRNGMAGEYGHDVQEGKVGSHVDSGFVESNFDMGKTKYISRASYQVPRCVIKDALNKQNGFRRRHGIPEGLPIGPDGIEIGEYRWSRSKLSRNHFATATTLAANSLFHCLEQIATSDWTHASSWELDYMEMCVFRSPIVARRFPSPGSKIVSSSQTFQPDEQDEEARKRAMPCPYPSADGVWSSNVWRQWISQVQNGNIIVPAVSWQAWWTLIAVLNGGDGSDRALDVQLKAESEPFSALDDLEAVYL